MHPVNRMPVTAVRRRTIRLPSPPAKPVVRSRMKASAGGETGEEVMKAVVYRGPFDVEVEEVDDPRIETPLDAIVKITTANICGSDLHPYEGRSPMESGMVIGHENMGIVVEVGGAVDRI